LKKKERAKDNGNGFSRLALVRLASAEGDLLLAFGGAPEALFHPREAPEHKQEQERTKARARTNKSKMRGFFAALRMTSQLRSWRPVTFMTKPEVTLRMAIRRSRKG